MPNPGPRSIPSLQLGSRIAKRIVSWNRFAFCRIFRHVYLPTQKRKSLLTGELTNVDLDGIVAEYARKYPAYISAEQAAEIAQRPTATLYDWSSRGLLDAFKSKRGRKVLFGRDAFVRWLAGNDGK